MNFLRCVPLFGAALACLSMSAALAQGTAAFPQRPVKIVVPVAAGGGSDLMARHIAERLGPLLGQTVIVENRVGANSVLAAQYALSQPADGHTVMMTNSVMALRTALPNSPYDLRKDFDPVIQVGNGTYILYVNANLPVKNVKELIAHAKAKPNEANYASTSGVFQLTNELFKLKTGTAFEMIPFKSSNEMIQGVITGQAMIGFIDPTALMPQYKAGTVRILATTGAKRAADYPEIPTMAEEGVDDVVVSGNTALVAPAGVPQAILKKLETEVNAILKMPDVIERFKTLAVYPMGGPGEKFAAEAAADRAKWRDVMKAAKIPLQ